jgi:hypothetical protein
VNAIVIFPSAFVNKILYEFLLSTTPSICPAYVIILDFIIKEDEIDASLGRLSHSSLGECIGCEAAASSNSTKLDKLQLKAFSDV